MSTDIASNEDERRRQAAAEVLQRFWRSRNGNEAKPGLMDPDIRWRDAATHTRLKMGRVAANRNENAPSERWKRNIFFASRLQDANNHLQESGVDKPHVKNKELEVQHWLELIDGLDVGDGKSLSLDECPRSQLEQEKIQYLSTEQRLNYLVKIDAQGRLRWDRNNELIDTSAGHWKDSGNGQGIIPEEIPQRPARHGSFASSMSSSSISSEESDEVNHYIGNEKGKSKVTRMFHRYFTIKGITNRLLRKTVRRNTWIFVSDKHFNIFIGIKGCLGLATNCHQNLVLCIIDTGTFQHSSFLAGGLVTSAGLITVREGVIHSLSPLSGHYRTTIEHYHQFLDILTERGVDMRKVKASKAEMALWGVEHIAKTKKAQSRLVAKGKQRAKGATEKIFTVPNIKSASDTRWKRDIFRGHRTQKSDLSSTEKGGGPITQSATKEDNRILD
ncbi:uncharacterized protein ARMOST_08849 [Armillaria ostoyae]|uniref:Uncharacterized protein n=1 Tax=Armillaria ostoyae TaxID=47428 RepID=A0A284R9R8_ARMOS|nr:uncharacterized protein ARMOST_08849 [Armillaria ostoyae]